MAWSKQDIRRTPDKNTKIVPVVRQRIFIPQSPTRPIDIHTKDLVKKEYVRTNPWWFTAHRRGIKRAKLGEDPLEMRAVPKTQIKGTLPERIVYKSLIDLIKLAPGIDFDFQSCMKSDHKILTSDLNWVEAKTLKAGDKLVSFDEDGPKRKYKTGTVISNSLGQAELFEVAFTNGESVFVTKEHPWLVYGDNRSPNNLIRGGTPMWFTTEKLKQGIDVPKFLVPNVPIKTWDSGYLAGFFDSEGSLIQTSQSAHEGTYTTVVASQNKGPTLDLMVKLVGDLGFNFSVYDYDGKYKRSYDNGKRRAVSVRIRGGMSESVRFLTAIRPPRLLNKFSVDKMGSLKNTYEKLTIKSITSIGEGEISRIEVDTHTYIGEGFAMHNSQEGGRIQLGGLVADFLFPIMKIVIQVQGPTHNIFIRIKKDSEQQDLLADMGYRVFEIEDEIIYNEYRYEAWLRNLFNIGGVGGGTGNTFNVAGQATAVGALQQDISVDEGEIGDEKRLNDIYDLLNDVYDIMRRSI